MFVAIFEFLFNSLWGWLSITTIIVIACGLVAWFVPPFRRLALMAAASTVTLRQPSASGGMADSASGAYSSKPKGVYTSFAVLQPNQLQDLVDVLDDIVKAAVGVPLRFQLQISLGDGEDIGSAKVEEVNKLLESVSPELRVKP